VSPEDVHRAQDLLRAQTDLKCLLARHCNRPLRFYPHEVDGSSPQPYLPARLGRTVVTITLALVQSELAAMGIETNSSLTRNCDDCGGSGKVPI